MKVFFRLLQRDDMKRIFHHYELWEDFQAGMWRNVSGNEKIDLLRKAIEFTGDDELYGDFMLRVIVEWPYTCEQNLTDLNQNRKAWIGHAATCLAIDCPEDITRLAWAQLTQQQQDDANEKAEQAIKKWEIAHEEKNLRLHQKMGDARLSQRNTGSSSEQIRVFRQMPLIPENMYCDFKE